MDKYIDFNGLKKLCERIVSKTAKKASFDEHVGNKSNPHGVTKSQVGLGNVPNVATNNQTPTYTAAETLAKLVTGEKLGVAFGKIAKAVDEMITHLEDSVRHVTAEERTNWNDKAAGNHTHPAQTSVSGNAGTATKLATARTINGVAFDGSANITVPNLDYQFGSSGENGITFNPFNSFEGMNRSGHYSIGTIDLDFANSGVTSNENKLTENAGDYQALLLCDGFTSTGQPRWGKMILTSPRNNTTWIGQIWENKFIAWQKLAGSLPATPTTDGLMSAADKTKLDAIKYQRFMKGGHTNSSAYMGFYQIAGLHLPANNGWGSYSFRILAYEINEANFNDRPIDLTISLYSNSENWFVKIWGEPNALASNLMPQLYVSKLTTGISKEWDFGLYWKRTVNWQTLLVEITDTFQKNTELSLPITTYPNTPVESIEKDGYSAVNLTKTDSAARVLIWGSRFSDYMLKSGGTFTGAITAPTGNFTDLKVTNPPWGSGSGISTAIFSKESTTITNSADEGLASGKSLYNHCLVHFDNLTYGSGTTLVIGNESANYILAAGESKTLQTGPKMTLSYLAGNLMITFNFGSSSAATVALVEPQATSAKYAYSGFAIFYNE